jgi:hypothetical protein
MDAEKSKKLQQYAIVLNEQATQEEKNGRAEEATKLYLKLVDVFLVLAAEAQDHNTWQQYIRQAEAYQARIRDLNKDGGGSQTVVPQKREVPNPPQEIGSGNSDSSQKPSPLKKMFRPFQKNEDTGESQQKTATPRQALQQQPQSAVASPVSPRISAAESTVPAEVYQRVVSENKILRDKINAYSKESEEKIASLQNQKRDLEARVSEMVPRSDYDAMQAEFANMVPRTEYNRLRSELLSSVPKEHYDDLINRIAEMVPKKVYLDAERKIMELEDAIRNSVPKKVMDDIASEVSLLGLLSEIPMEKGQEEEQQQQQTVQLES